MHTSRITCLNGIIACACDGDKERLINLGERSSHEKGERKQGEGAHCNWGIAMYIYKMSEWRGLCSKDRISIFTVSDRNIPLTQV